MTDAPTSAPRAGGANPSSGQSRKKRPPPFSLRLSPEERARLARDAAGQSLGGYVRARLFGPDAAPAPRTRGRFPVKDHQALGMVLAQFGASRLSSNLNQIAKAADRTWRFGKESVGARVVHRGRQCGLARGLLALDIGTR